MSDEFEGKSLLARHRMVNALFSDDMTGETPKMHGEELKTTFVARKVQLGRLL